MNDDDQEPHPGGFDPDLGYDPQPHLKNWKGTPIPPVDRPLKLTPERARICDHVWWWGGPEIALRNCRHYIYHVIDYGSNKEREFTMQDVPREIWQYALNTARQGMVNRGGHKLFSLWMGADHSISDDWGDEGSRYDWHRRATAVRRLRDGEYPEPKEDPVSIRLTTNLQQRVDYLTDLTGKSRSEVVRVLLRAVLDIVDHVDFDKGAMKRYEKPKQ